MRYTEHCSKLKKGQTYYFDNFSKDCGVFVETSEGSHRFQPLINNHYKTTRMQVAFKDPFNELYFQVR